MMNEMMNGTVMTLSEEDARLHEITEKWTIKQAALMNKRGTLTFENPRQRSYVWERFRKADLIDTILRAYPIPAFYTKKENGVYDFLDGKQRMSAICGFINDEYALTVMRPFGYVDDESGEDKVVDITGKKFSELPEELKDIIRSYTLDVRYYEGITDRQVTTMFKKLNNGKPLSAKDKNIANAIDLKHLMEIGENPLFSILYKENFLNAKKHLSIIMKIWAMLYMELDKVSFESRVFNPIMANTIISEEQGEEMQKVFNALYDAYGQIDRFAGDDAAKIKKKIRGELHIVSIAWFIRYAMNHGIEDEEIAKFICHFYGGDNKSISEVYNDASSSSTAKNINIRRRHNELMKEVCNFFSIEEADVNGVEAESEQDSDA